MFSSKFPEEFKVKKSLEILGIVDNFSFEEQNFILNEISEYIFDVSVKQAKGAKIFDYNLDFKYYFLDFKKLGIDLLDDKVNWFKFNMILNELIYIKDTRINEIIGYRVYDNQDILDQERHNYNMKLKEQYSLPNTDFKNTGFNKLWDYAERKVDDSK